MNEPEGPKIAIDGIRGGRMTWQPTQDGKRIEILGRCVVTKRLHRVEVERAEIEAFDRDSKRTIADQFPSLLPDLGAVEFLISGLSPAGWSQIFGDDDGSI